MSSAARLAGGNPRFLTTSRQFLHPSVIVRPIPRYPTLSRHLAASASLQCTPPPGAPSPPHCAAPRPFHPFPSPTLPTPAMPPTTLSNLFSHAPLSARPFRRAFRNPRLSFHDSLTLPRAFPRLPTPSPFSPPRPLPHWKRSANMVSEAFPDFPRRLVRSIGFPVSHRVIHSLWITLWVTC